MQDGMGVIGYLRAIYVLYCVMKSSHIVRKIFLRTVKMKNLYPYGTYWYTKNSVDHMDKVIKSDNLYGKSLEHVHEVTPDL